MFGLLVSFIFGCFVVDLIGLFIVYVVVCDFVVGVFGLVFSFGGELGGRDLFCFGLV